MKSLRDLASEVEEVKEAGRQDSAGGVRKARWCRQAKGERGAKNEQADMSPEDRKAAKAFVEELKRAKEEKRR